MFLVSIPSASDQELLNRYEKVKPVAYPDPATINFTVGAQ